MPDSNQDRIRRILFICLMNRARSPTAEWEARLRGFDADSAGTEDGAVVELRDDHLRWADVVICMDRTVVEHIRGKVRKADVFVPVLDWHIPDNYNAGEPVLVNRIRERLKLLEPLKHMIPDTQVAPHSNPRADGVVSPELS